MIGTRLGPYEIVAKVGEGGMGEVYRARDSKLDRDVAIKVLPESVAHVPDRHARFAREAKTLAALNHPNIALVHGLEDAGEVSALVMEFVDGEDLAQKLARGPLPFDDTIAIARQVIDALEAAHSSGIVHRDLKPANIKVRADGTVKVLDFGLAKADAFSSLSNDVANSPTLTAHLTSAGVILGTAAYMAPEQAKGRTVDARADIWAFGVVLYEMLTGRQPFAGETTQDVLAAVLTREVDWRTLPATLPESIVRLLRRCLQRDPTRRLRHIGDARLELDDVGNPEPGGRPNPIRRLHLWHFATAAATVVAMTLGVQAILRPAGNNAANSAPMIFGMNEPGEPLYMFGGPVTLSPDGTRVALVTNGVDGKPRIWLRALDASNALAVEGAEGGMNPFWSYDGRSLAFYADNQLKVIDLVTRVTRSIAQSIGFGAGGAWNREGVILFADSGGLQRVSPGGGDVSHITTIADASMGREFHIAPQFLPDGNHYVYFAGNAVAGEGAIFVASLDSTTTRRLFSSPSFAVYAEPGYLLYSRSGQLIAQRFDATRLSLEGDPEVVASGVWAWNSGGLVALSASSTGLMMYASRRSVITRLTWFDRSGRPIGTVGEAGEWNHVEVSPDERTIAAERMDGRTGIGTIWTIDIERNVPSRLTPEPVWSLGPIWSPDGKRIAFAASREGASNLYIKMADGSGSDQRLYVSGELKVPTDWTRDGRIVFNANTDIHVLPAAGNAAPAALVSGPFTEHSGRVSPDGQWLAYVSNESGRPEVYVRSLDGTARWPISRSGGWQPRWRRDGKELFFLAADSTLMAARVTSQSNRFAAGEPEPLPIKLAPDVTGWRYGYDVVGLGQRFLVSNPAGTDLTPPLTAILNWPGLLRRQKLGT